MKISAGQVEGFINTLSSDFRAVLVYGPDEGLVRERAVSITGKIVGDSTDSFNTQEFSGASLAKDPPRLIDEVLAISFSGDRRVLVVRDSGDEMTAPLSNVLSNDAAAHPQSAFIVVAAGNLPPRSSLRRLFESDSGCAALPCYPDDEAGLAQLIRTSLSKDAISIEPSALHVAASLMGTDRQANRRELEKLILFAGPQGHISEDMVLTCLGDSAEASAEEAVLSAADGNYEALVVNLARVWADGTEPVAVIRNAQRHFQRLHYVLSQANNGVALDSALKQLRPPLFWRIAGRFRSQTNYWSLPTVEASLSRLTDAELSAKSTGAPAALVCDRALLSIAQLARSGRP